MTTPRALAAVDGARRHGPSAWSSRARRRRRDRRAATGGRWSVRGRRREASVAVFRAVREGIGERARGDRGEHGGADLGGSVTGTAAEVRLNARRRRPALVAYSGGLSMWRCRWRATHGR